jgi:hypothetical protein
MTSAKAVIGAIAGYFLFRISIVQTVEHLGRFVRVEAGAAAWDKCRPTRCCRSR